MMAGSGNGNRKQKVSSTRAVETTRIVTRVLVAALKVADSAFSVAAVRSWNRLTSDDYISPQERVFFKFSSSPIPE